MNMTFFSILFFLINLIGCNSSAPESTKTTQPYQHSGQKIVGKAKAVHQEMKTSIQFEGRIYKSCFRNDS